MALNISDRKSFATVSDMLTKLNAKVDVQKTLQKFILSRFPKYILDFVKIEDAVLPLAEDPKLKHLVDAALLKIKMSGAPKRSAPLCDDEPAAKRMIPVTQIPKNPAPVESIVSSKSTTSIPEHFLSSKRTAPTKFNPKPKNIIIESESSTTQIPIIKQSSSSITTSSNPCKPFEMSIEQRNRIERLKRKNEEKKIGEAKVADNKNILEKAKQERMARLKEELKNEGVPNKKKSTKKCSFKPYF